MRTVNHSNVSSAPDNKTIQKLFPIDNPSITEHEKDLHYILKRHENVISWGPNDLGSVISIKHKITMGGAEPKKAL